MNMGVRREHRRLKLSTGDIYLETKKAKFEPIHPVHKTQASDPFLSYKESCTTAHTQINYPHSGQSNAQKPLTSNAGFDPSRAGPTDINCSPNCAPIPSLATTSRVTSFAYFGLDAARVMQHGCGG